MSTPTTPTLSARQAEVLSLFAEGYSLREIGETLYLSRCTVKNHCANVTRLYGVHSTLEAVVCAVRDGAIVLTTTTTTQETIR